MDVEPAEVPPGVALDDAGRHPVVTEPDEGARFVPLRRLPRRHDGPGGSVRGVEVHREPGERRRDAVEDRLLVAEASARLVVLEPAGPVLHVMLGLPRPERARHGTEVRDVEYGAAGGHPVHAPAGGLRCARGAVPVDEEEPDGGDLFQGPDAPSMDQRQHAEALLFRRGEPEREVDVAVRRIIGLLHLAAEVLRHEGWHGHHEAE